MVRLISLISGRRYLIAVALRLMLLAPGPGLYGQISSAVEPRSGSGAVQALRGDYTYAGSAGFAGILDTAITITPDIFGAASCTPFYSAAQKLFSLNADNGSSAGWIAPGAAQTIENSYCILYGATSRAEGSGNVLRVTYSLAFKASYAGQNKIYSVSTPVNGPNSGWQYQGGWTVPGTAVLVIGAVTPPSDSGAVKTFRGEYSYTGSTGFAGILDGAITITPEILGSASCTPSYNATLRLFSLNADNAGSAGSVAAGSTRTVENSYCKLYGATSHAEGSGSVLQVTYSLAFKASFAGPKKIYSVATPVNGSNTGWQFRGDWTVPTAPSVPGVGPKAYVVNNRLISVINTTDNKVLSAIAPVVGTGLISIAMSPNGLRAYVLDFNIIHIIDTSRDIILKSLPLTPTRNSQSLSQYGLALSVAGDRLYMLTGVPNAVPGITSVLTVFDTALMESSSNPVLRNIAVGCGKPGGVAVDSRSIYVGVGGNYFDSPLAGCTSATRRGRVYVFDVAAVASTNAPAPTHIKETPSGDPNAMVIASNGRKVLVSTSTGYVSVIDTSNWNSAVHNLKWGGSRGLALRGSKLLATGNLSDVYLIDVDSEGLLDSFQAGSYPSGVAFTPDGAKAYVVNNANNSGPSSVSVIEFPTRNITSTDIRPKGSAPFAIGIQPLVPASR